MSRKPYLKYILVFGVLSVAVAIIAVTMLGRTSAPGAGAGAEQATQDKTLPAQQSDLHPDGEETASETPGPDDVSPELLEAPLDLVEESEERRRTRLLVKGIIELDGVDLEARDELMAKVSQRDMALEEKIALLEEFIEKFGVNVDTWRQSVMLAQSYSFAKRIDEARGLYRRVMEMPNGAFHLKHGAGMGLAGLEAINGNVAAAEKILLDVIESPIPEHYAQGPGVTRQDMETQQKFEAPLRLADLYMNAGRFEEASEVLDAVVSYAVSLPSDHSRYTRIPEYVGHAYDQRVRILVEQAAKEQIDESVDEVIEAALALADGYTKSLEGMQWSGGERPGKYIAEQQDFLRMTAIGTACLRKIDSLFEGANADSIDEARRSAGKFIEECRERFKDYQWRTRDAAQQFQQMMDHQSRLAEEKRAGE